MGRGGRRWGEGREKEGFKPLWAGPNSSWASSWFLRQARIWPRGWRPGSWGPTAFSPHILSLGELSRGLVATDRATDHSLGAFGLLWGDSVRSPAATGRYAQFEWPVGAIRATNQRARREHTGRHFSGVGGENKGDMLGGPGGRPAPRGSQIHLKKVRDQRKKIRARHRRDCRLLGRVSSMPNGPFPVAVCRVARPVSETWANRALNMCHSLGALPSTCGPYLDHLPPVLV